MSDTSEIWYKSGLQFNCQSCGSCCTGEPGYVWVTSNDIQRMANRMNLAAAIFENFYVRKVRGKLRSLKERSNGDCVLLDEISRTCLVYDERPIQCRTWPFWQQNLSSPKAWKKTAKACPGCNRGQHYSLDEIEERKEQTELY